MNSVWKRVISFMLCAVMVLGFVPTEGLAVGAGSEGELSSLDGFLELKIAPISGLNERELSESEVANIVEAATPEYWMTDDVVSSVHLSSTTSGKDVEFK